MATGQPFARRWAHETPSFAGLPATKAPPPPDEAATDMGERSKYAGNSPEARAARARHAALVRYGKENPLQARLAAIRAARKGKGKGKAAPKPKPDRAAERAQQEAANLDTVGEALLDADSPLSKRGLESLAAFAAGGALAPDQAKELAALGVVEIGKDGTPRLSADGRAVVTAARRGDVRGALDAASAAGERAAGEKPATPTAKPSADLAGAPPADAKPKKGGGGGGGKGKKDEPKPSAAEQDAERAKARAERGRATAGEVGLKPADYDALRAAADGAGDTPPAALAKLGLVGADGLTTDAGRRALGALERGDRAGYQAALQDVRAATQRRADADKRKADAEAARTARERTRTDAAAAREKAKADKERQELDDLADDFRSKARGLSMREQRRLVRAGRATFGPDGKFALTAATKSWRWAVKAEDDTLTPPAAVQAAARRALDRRAKAPPSQRGMTPVGLARARDLSNGKPVSVATARRMVNYFTRHQQDKAGATWGDYGPGRQAWDGWGGDAGWRWARGVVARADARSTKETR